MKDRGEAPFDNDPQPSALSKPPTEALDVERLRANFLRLLTEDSETKDRRRREYNLAIFDAEKGYAIWTSTDLGMVMSKFDRAARLLPH